MRKLTFYFLSVISLTSVLVLTGCPGGNSPTSPSNPTPINTPLSTSTSTSTPTVTSTPITGIYWYNAFYYRYSNSGTPIYWAGVDLTVNGQPTTNVVCFVTGGGLSSPITLPFNYVSTAGAQSYARYEKNNGGLAYQPGQNYTLTTISGAVTSSSTLTAPGNITNAPDGSQASWTFNGNYEEIQVTNLAVTVLTYDSTTYYSPANLLTSPFSVPATAYSGGGSFTLTTYIQTKTNSVAGAASGSSFYMSDELVTSVVVATPTVTSTPTSTPTNLSGFTSTFTPTATSTFTPTPSFTSTPTITRTFTPSFTFTPTSTFTITFTNTLTPTSTWTPNPTPSSAGISWTYNNGAGSLAYSPYSGGVIYTGSNSNPSITRFNLIGTPLSPSYFGPGTFNAPKYVAVDSLGYVYATDFYNNEVQCLDNNGNWVWTQGVTTAGAGVSQFNSPEGIVVGGGYIFVADNGNGRIVALNPSNGAWLFSFTGSLPTVLNSPDALAWDSTNNVLYVTDTGYGNAFTFTNTGSVLKTWGSFTSPQYIAVNASGTVVYVSDLGQHNIQSFDSNGNHLDTFGSAGTGYFQFGGSPAAPSPFGLAVDPSGKLYVDDYGNNLIKVYSGKP